MAMHDAPPEVAARFATLPAETRKRLLAWRALAFDLAASDARIGVLTETLKWGQPSYLTQATRSGGTLRLWVTRHGRPAVFVTCSSDLADRIRDRYGEELDFEGNRAIIPHPGTSDAVLRHVVGQVLTYRLR